MSQELTRILLVDDDRAVNFLNRYVIKKACCAEYVQTAENGQQALDILNLGIEHTDLLPDLILVDINMPCTDGWEFLEGFKRLEFDRKDKIKIVMISSSIDADDRTRAERISEVSGFMNKPLTPEKLDIILQEHFDIVPSPYQ